MLLATLLKEHRSYRYAGALKDCIGDAYLMSENPIYRNVRKTAVKFGFKFVPAWTDYLWMPFAQLPQIIRQKKIPYARSSPIYAQIEKAQPNYFQVHDLPQTIRSYHFHEAAHCVAESIFARVNLKTKNEKILKALMCESFANTVEALALTSSNSELHKVFLDHNSYFEPRKDKPTLRNQVLADIGTRATFKLIYFSYLHANFLFKAVSEKDFQKIYPLFFDEKVPSEARIFKRCFRLFNYGLKLNLEFVVYTTQFHFAYQGIKGSIFDLLNFDFMKLLKKNTNFMEAFEQLSSIAEGGPS